MRRLERERQTAQRERGASTCSHEKWTRCRGREGAGQRRGHAVGKPSVSFGGGRQARCRPKAGRPQGLQAFRFFLYGLSCFPVDNLDVVLRRAATELGSEALEVLLGMLLLIVDMRIYIGLILLEHVVDISQELAPHGHDGLLVALAPLHEALELAPHRRVLRLHRGLGAFYSGTRNFDKSGVACYAPPACIRLPQQPQHGGLPCPENVELLRRASKATSS